MANGPLAVLNSLRVAVIDYPVRISIVVIEPLQPGNDLMTYVTARPP